LELLEKRVSETCLIPPYIDLTNGSLSRIISYKEMNLLPKKLFAIKPTKKIEAIVKMTPTPGILNPTN
jgi:hypothetical protein